ncbi:putative FBD-associated F-box protein At1g55030 [Capsella rubella]|uniref:putative FBD-associated F-box protein At1g55030 n=1 Tax=Capsella rubella TaxID=81985 RepID=UPI000CD4E193|nr:putative FBD-associated F-box protein At1g55030 [Capsella rubella]
MKRCKRNSGDERKNDASVVKEDRISELPESLILKILCQLPIQQAVATSVLCKQWQSVWKMIPKLKFDYFPIKHQLGNVCKFLLSHKAPVLQSFQLKVDYIDRHNVVDIVILIGIALTRNVRKLVLEVSGPAEVLITFPTSLYNGETLETLTLRRWVLHFPSQFCLKSLKNLHLDYVNYKDNETFLNLLSGCPNLETLKILSRITNSSDCFFIAVPSLQRLSIDNDLYPPCSYAINTPSLKYLKISGSIALESCLIENVPELVEADIDIEVSNHITIISENLLGPLTSVRRLTLALSSLKIEFPISVIFYQLVYLELYTDREAWGNLLIHMLGCSPKLQVLKLNGGCNEALDPGEWNQPKNIPECLLLHLETFTWKGYKWQRKKERKVAKYILKSSNHLKRATFLSSKRICSTDRRMMVKYMKSLVKDKFMPVSIQMKHLG